MTIATFIRYVYDLARKDGKGNVVSPQAIVNWLTYVMLDNFNELLTQALTLAEQKQVPLANVIFDIKDLRQFVKTTTLSPTVVRVGGIKQLKATLPTDFKYELGCISGSVVTDPNLDQMNPPSQYDTMNNVELLSSTLLPKYRASVINNNPEESPKAFVGAGHIEFIPNDLENITFTYLRTPAKPYYDFCIDNNDAEIFMPAGSYINQTPITSNTDIAPPPLPGVIYKLFAADGTILANNVTKTGQSIYTNPSYTSLTVDLDWDEINHVRFANNVAHKLGINLKNPILTQTQ